MVDAAAIGQTLYREFSIPNVISDIAGGRHKRLQVMSSARLPNMSVCFDFSLVRDFSMFFWKKVLEIELKVNRQVLLSPPLLSLLSDSSMASNLPPEHYYSEANRLETFRRWTKKTPKPSDLASAGLFYEGNRDYVKCAFCSGVIGCWDDTEDLPMIEHQNLYPTCPFVLGMNYSSKNSFKNNSLKES